MPSADPHHVPAGEKGVVRVFTTDLEPEGNAAITATNVGKLLGTGLELNAKQVEVFPSRVIEGLGLARYLAEGYGIPEEAMAGKAAALDALSGLTIIIRSAAFGGKELTLDPHSGLRFIGAFRETPAARPTRMAEREAAKGVLTPTGLPPGVHATKRLRGSWIIAVGALIIAAVLVLSAVF